MKYSTYVALVGLTQAKVALVIDDAKIVSTANDIAQSVQMEATRPEAIAVGQALQQELEVAALKVEMSMGKIMTPMFEALENGMELESYGEDCKVHDYYQCLVDEGIQNEPWMAQWTAENGNTNPSQCPGKTQCIRVSDNMTWEEYNEFSDEQNELEDEIKGKLADLAMPIQDSFMKAFVEQQANVAKIQQNLGPSLKSILTNYGCDAACLDSVPLDVVNIAQATTYCACPAVIEIKQAANFKSMDVSKVLADMEIPETQVLRKRTPMASDNQKAALNLVSAPEIVQDVVPQTSYMSNGLMAAAVFAGGYFFGKKRSPTKEDDSFAALI